MSSFSENVILLYGGLCDERLVSVASGQNLAAHMPQAEGWFWAPDGAVHRVSREELLAHERPFEVELKPAEPPRWATLEAALDSAAARGKTFFLALHGGQGEDGTVQRWLEARRLAYTGSGPEASRRAMDKALAKETVQREGVPVAEGETLSEEPAAAAAQLRALLLRHGRLAVKPVGEGSSTGLRFVCNEQEVELAVADATEQAGRTFLAEAFLSGVELTVGVLEEPGGLRALPCTEIRKEAGSRFDYAGKYLGQGCREITPAEVAEETARAAQRTAVRAHQALGCTGYSRTDLIVGADGPVFLELNTLPGLTRASLIPQQLAAAGISMAEFLAGQIQLARAARR